jgi:hypothetical protein
VGSKTTSDAFFVADLGVVVDLYRQWMTSMANIQPFYVQPITRND